MGASSSREAGGNRSGSHDSNAIVSLLIAAGLSVAGGPVPLIAASPEPPAHLTSEQDHQRMMDLLHIGALRRGPDGDPKSPNAANFDESKVTPYYNLPDPLVLKNGERVRTRAFWSQRRRPEIVADFDREVYGRVPRDLPGVSWTVTRESRETVGNVPVVTQDVVGHVDNSSYPEVSVDIQLTVTTPANIGAPVPVIMELALSPEVVAAMRKRLTEAQRTELEGAGPGWQSLVLAKGWGYASLIATSVQADSGDGLTQGVIGLVNKGKPRRPDDWGALRAWAWGASRALDYLETDKSVDARQVGIEGLSRYGKAALVAMAYEPRFAIGFIGSSGEGGAKILRRHFGEQVENLASSAEYHWMAGNFLKYAGPLTANDLPVDAHELIALCAPRPVFISSGSPEVEGGWVDAKGSFLGAVGAGPVYELLGKRGLGTAEFPPLQTALIDGDVAFRQHAGGHTTGPNWPTFLTFASRYIKGPGVPPAAALASAAPAAPAAVTTPSPTPTSVAGIPATAVAPTAMTAASRPTVTQPPPKHQPGAGIFEGQSDVGSVVPAGSGSYSPATGTYTLTSAGANTWYHVDDFHYLWKQASGDLALTAEIAFPPHAYPHDPNPHRKGILMFRQTLDPGGIYAAAGEHGSGMMALQYRRERGANTQDVELNIDAVRTVRIEKRGDTFTLFLSMKGEAVHQVGASVMLHLNEPFFVGLGVVSHDVGTTDKVEFSNVSLQPLPPAPPDTQLTLYSTLQTVSIDDQFRRAMMIRTVPAYMQSANWAPDGRGIYVHEEGRVERIPYLTPPAGGAPEAVDTGKLLDCSGNFGVSPDGRLLALSCAETHGGPHEVYVQSTAGVATPRKVTNSTASSFFHAWSPDSRIIAFTRGSADKADIFTVPVTGGEELRLTRDTVNDGPDYSPDGQFIYFDSARSGALQIWRMKPDGSGAEQLTDDDRSNSSPHVSRDGRTLAFLSQPAASGPGIGAAALRVMDFKDGLIRTLVDFQGNRGSFSMYGWGDATHLAFVSYQKLPGRSESSPRAGH